MPPANQLTCYIIYKLGLIGEKYQTVCHIGLTGMHVSLFTDMGTKIEGNYAVILNFYVVKTPNLCSFVTCNSAVL